MHPDQRLRKSVKGFYAYVGSVLLAMVSPPIADWLVHQPPAATRTLGVIVGVGGWVPLMVIVAHVIRASDEFTQRIHYLSLSISFGVGFVVIASLDWLVRAGFIEPIPYMVLWLAMAVVWVITLFTVKHRLERVPSGS